MESFKMADVTSRCRFSLNFINSSRHKMILSVLVDKVRFRSTTRKKGTHLEQKARCAEDNISQTRGNKETDLYTSLRMPAERLRRLRNYYFSRASQAYKRGQGNMAKRMSTQGRMYNAALQREKRQCVNEILKMSNIEYKLNVDFSSPKTLNLHGLHVREAIDAVEKFLEKHSEYKGRFRIITGWGSNGYPRKPQLLPAVKEMLLEQGRYFREIQPGVIEVIN